MQSFPVPDPIVTQSDREKPPTWPSSPRNNPEAYIRHKGPSRCADASQHNPFCQTDLNLLNPTRLTTVPNWGCLLFRSKISVWQHANRKQMTWTRLTLKLKNNWQPDVAVRNKYPVPQIHLYEMIFTAPAEPEPLNSSHFPDWNNFCIWNEPQDSKGGRYSRFIRPVLWLL